MKKNDSLQAYARTMIERRELRALMMPLIVDAYNDWRYNHEFGEPMPTEVMLSIVRDARSMALCVVAETERMQ